MDPYSVFTISDQDTFNASCLERFREQYLHIPAYRKFCDLTGRSPDSVDSHKDIPFLPIEFFKSHLLLPPDKKAEVVFRSSGTTGSVRSSHHVPDLRLYEKSFTSAFELFYGSAESYCILALLPSYQQQPGSSLIYMVDTLIRKSRVPGSGFLSGTPGQVAQILRDRDTESKPVLLIGVSFALLDLAQQAPVKLSNTIVMETGGMKGRRKELVREALHDELMKGLGQKAIHSEYGMTELLSQAYSTGEGRFSCPPWMRVFPRDPEDPYCFLGHQQTGGLNIVDLANRYSCSFIATQDLGKTHEDGTFEVLGRFDNSDIRGCNLMTL
jgi:phenylacetate-coenzyme A ligase PaaK-like adenylate-forming protein